jgi:GNAT superfamily N-acetyltransferase
MKGGYSVKHLRMHNYREVKNIFYDTFDLHDDVDFFAAWRNRNQRSSMGLFYRGTLIGFGLVAGKRLWFLAIVKQFRGNGIGSFLLNSILKTMNSCYLTPVNDPKIINWYERHGFRISQILRPASRWRVPVKEPSKYKPHERWALSQPRHIMAFHRYATRSAIKLTI